MTNLFVDAVLSMHSLRHCKHRGDHKLSAEIQQIGYGNLAAKLAQQVECVNARTRHLANLQEGSG